MKTALKIVWISAIVLLFLSMIWFALASTAFFSRSIVLDDVAVYIVAYPAALIFIGLSIWFLKKGACNTNRTTQMVWMALVLFFSTLFIIPLVDIDIRERLKDKVDGDYIQLTSDGQYEYQLRLVNIFEKNSHALLRVKEISTGKETTISVDIRTNEISALRTPPTDPNTAPPVATWIWSKMNPSDGDNYYILTTTERLKDNIEVFEIDMETKTSRRLE